VGTIQPVKELAARAHAEGYLFHCDAVQSFGKVRVIPESEGIDSLSISAHKLHGPVGVGALYIKEGVLLAPLLHGEGQEGGMRSGTIAVHQVVGFGAAAEIARRKLKEEEKRQRELVFRLEKMLKEMSGATRNGHATECLPGILNVRIKGVDAALLARALNTKFGVCVHSAPRGSASLVLKAMGKTDTEATQSIRISLSRFSTEEQMKFFAGSIQPAIRLSQMKS